MTVWKVLVSSKVTDSKIEAWTLKTEIYIYIYIYILVSPWTYVRMFVVFVNACSWTRVRACSRRTYVRKHAVLEILQNIAPRLNFQEQTVSISETVERRKSKCVVFLYFSKVKSAESCNCRTAQITTYCFSLVLERQIGWIVWLSHGRTQNMVPSFNFLSSSHLKILSVKLYESWVYCSSGNVSSRSSPMFWIYKFE